MASFRVFISSTFKNFESERNYLARNLYTSLDDRCRLKGYAFHAIDLRWGISNEASLDNKSMELCLDEIKKCQASDIKPNFLMMLGDYYGWKPLPFRIEKNEAEKLLSIMDNDNVLLFEKCYRLDTNNVPAEYVLQGRSGELVDNDVWLETERQLHDALEDCANQVLQGDALHKYIYSATHQEIIQGFLRDDVIKDYTFVFVKEEGNIYNNQSDYNKAQQLKSLVLSVLPETQYAIYRTEEEFIKAVEKAEAFLSKTIDNQLTNLVELDKQLLYLEKYKENYIRDEELEQKVVKEIINSKGKKVFITSGKYDGKTSFLLSLYNLLVENNQYKTFLWCADSDREHLSVIDLCNFIIKKFTNGKRNPYLEYENACYHVQEVLGMGKKNNQKGKDNQKIVFMIDGLDTLFDSDKVIDAFYEITLPHNVTFVLTASKEKFNLKNATSYAISQFSPEKKELLFDSVLTSNNRCLTDKQRSSILPIIHNSNLLMVRQLSTKLLNMRSYDDGVYNFDCYESYVKDEFDHLSSPEMYGGLLISRILLYLAFSPYGISEGELFDLLKKDGELINFLKSTANWGFDESVGIPQVILYRVIADLSGYIYEYNQRGEIIYKLSSHMLEEIILNYYSKNLIEHRYSYYKEFFKGRPVYLNSKKEIDERIARQWMIIASKEEDELYKGLTAKNFCDACIKLGEIHFLISGFKKLNLTDRVEYKTIIKYLPQLIVFNDMFLTYLATENGVQIPNYKRFSFDDKLASKQRITNWMNDTLELYGWISKNEYVITYENSLVCIDSTNNTIKNRLNFNSQIVNGCISNDKRSLLIVCSQCSCDVSILKLYHIDLKQWKFINVFDINSQPQWLIMDDIRIIAKGNSEFILGIWQFNPLDNYIHCSNKCSLYVMGKDFCRLLPAGEYLQSTSVIGPLFSFVPISQDYLLVKYGISKPYLLNLKTDTIFPVGKRFKNLRFDLNNAVVSTDGKTYCLVERVGLFVLSIVGDKLKAHKVFDLLNKSKTALYSNKRFLADCFILKQTGYSIADIYAYDGRLMGNVEWRNNEFIMSVADQEVCFVDIGGACFKRKIDSSITFNQANVQLSINDSFGYLFKGISAFFTNEYSLQENQKNIYRLSPDGNCVAKLTKDGLEIKQNGIVIFQYIFKSKRYDSRDIGFISNHLLVWKQTRKKFKLIDIKNKTIKRLSVLRKNSTFIIHDNSVWCSKQKISFGDDGLYTTELIELNNYSATPESILLQLRRAKKAIVIFNCEVPSQLSFCELDKNVLIYASERFAIKYNNHRLFFYEYEDDGELLNSFIYYYNYYNTTKTDRSKFVSYNKCCYIYLEQFKMLVIYNQAGGQKIRYLLDDTVQDVTFDGDCIKLLHDDGKIETIKII